MQASTTSDLQEVRVYGLNKTITTEALGEFLGKGVRVRGILLHPQSKGTFQWAQVWVETDAEVMSLLGLRDALAVNGITISRVPTTAPTTTPPHMPWDSTPHLSRPRVAPAVVGLTPIHTSLFGRTDGGGSHPRNLYVLNLPLDLTQVEFKMLFTPFGMVEHSILLSQLDGIGRRRGFVLMSNHHEAVEAMCQMNGKWIDGSKLDVSWALVQREAKNMLNSSLPNRVVHPPTVSSRRGSQQPDSSVMVENLDPFLFPDTEAINSIFSTFGPISRVIKITDTSALIQFDLPISAIALGNANGLALGQRPLKTRILSGGAPSPGPNFDPFAEVTGNTNNWLEEALKQQTQSPTYAPVEPHAPITPQSMSSRTVRLSADSVPFVPGAFKTKLDFLTTYTLDSSPPSGKVETGSVQSSPGPHSPRNVSRSSRASSLAGGLCDNNPAVAA